VTSGDRPEGRPSAESPNAPGRSTPVAVRGRVHCCGHGRAIKIPVEEPADPQALAERIGRHVGVTDVKQRQMFLFGGPPVERLELRGEQISHLFGRKRPGFPAEMPQHDRL